MLRARARTVDDFSVSNRAFWADDYPIDPKAKAKNLGDPKTLELLVELGRRYESLEPFTLETAESVLRAYADEAGVKAGVLINGSRTVLTGSPVGPGIFDVMMALGKSRTAERLKGASQLTAGREPV